MKPCLVFLAAFVAVGCSSPSDEVVRPSVEFELGINRLQSEDRFVITPADHGSVAVKGYFRTPCSPYEATAAVTVDNSVVTVSVIGRDEDSWCPKDVVSDLGYIATIRHLDAGSYVLRVVHRWADANWPTELAHEAELTLD